MKTDKLIKYSIWSLLGAVAVIIIAFLNIANDSNKYLASYPEGSAFNEGVGYIAFFLSYYFIYTLVFIIWLVLLNSLRSQISNLWKKIQLITIFVLSVLPTLIIAVWFLVVSPNPFKQYPSHKAIPIESLVNDSITLDSNDIEPSLN